MKLKIGHGLTLPLEAVTETFAILGRRGSGKTHTAVVMAEEMLAAGVPVVVLDPLDVWWGLRVSKDGKAAGFPIYVAGGSHADIPLLPDAGKVIADAVVDKGLSIVLSVRHLSKTDQRRFVGEFCERLYDRKADPKHRTALHVFIDEADAFVPQRLLPGGERCYGAVDTMVRRGRSSGLAITLISQRPQVIAKDVLSQTEVLVAHQLTGPQDRKALDAWVEANDTEDRRGEFMASLASLPKGTAWFWSPGLLGIFKRVEVRDRHTFDSSATPKAGVSAVASPKAFAAVDLEKLTAEIAATIEKAKAENPGELRKEIALLRKQLAQAAAQANAKTEPVCQPTTVEKSILTEKDRQVLTAWTERMREQSAALTADLARIVEEVVQKVAAAVNVASADMVTLLSMSEGQAVRPLHTVQVQRVLEKLAALETPHRDTPTTKGDGRRVVPSATTARPVSVPAVRVSPPAEPVEGVTPARQRILNALAFFAGIGVRPVSKPQLALFVGVPQSSGGYKNNLGALRAAGFIEYPTPGDVALTHKGEALASTDGIPTTTSELHDVVRSLLTPARVKLLDTILDAHPRPIDRESLAEQCDVPATSGGFKNNLGAMRTLGIVTYPQPSTVAAAPALFLEGR